MVYVPYALSFARPFWRRLDIIFRPAAVDIRARKPTFRCRFFLDGWYTRFMFHHSGRPGYFRRPFAVDPDFGCPKGPQSYHLVPICQADRFQGEHWIANTAVPGTRCRQRARVRPPLQKHGECHLR